MPRGQTGAMDGQVLRGSGASRRSGRSHRRRPEVYRRRRVTVALVALGLVIAPVRLLGGGGGDQEVDARDQAAGAEDRNAEVDACAAPLADLALRERLSLLLMIGVSGDDPDDVAELLGGPHRPGGIFVRGGSGLFDAEVFASPPPDGLPLLVALDDEGGRVQPLDEVLEDLPSARTMAQMAGDDLEDLAEERGEALLELGVNTVFGPVVDVGSGAGIGDRSFGDTAEAVTAHAGAYARGLRAAGVLPVLKHFPGHGRASADTHDGPSTTPGVDSLRAVELRPYDSLVGEDPVGVMVGHLDVPGLTAEGVPASLSPDAVGLLRAAYDFDGLVVTDDLAAMPAITSRFQTPDAAERALAAGADLILLSQPTDVDAVLDRLVDAVDKGRIPARRADSALARVAAAAGCGAG